MALTLQQHNSGIVLDLAALKLKVFHFVFTMLYFCYRFYSVFVTLKSYR